MPVSFNELFARIPKKKRTDKVKVVVALYHLAGDHEKTATTTEVRDHLRLHLRKAAPTNVTDALTKATPYIEAVKVNGQRAWRVTQSGVGFLRDLSGDPEIGAGPLKMRSLTFESLHPEIQRAAEVLLRDGHNCDAVGRAAKALNLMVRTKTGRTRDDGVPMMHQVFSVNPNGTTRLQVNDLQQEWQRDEQEGIRFMAAGIQAAVANVDKHGDLGITDPALAMEVLATISFLARVVERSRVVT